jgi:sphinganine-1-phosphate aldolase
MAVAKVAAAGTINAEAEKMKAKLRHELHKDLGTVYATIPEEGISKDVILAHLAELRSKEEKKWSDGWVSGAVYLGEKEFGDFLNKVYLMYSSTNALHPDIWPSLRKFESEVVAMSIKMMRGGPDACGLMTSGGTESLVMACKTYRDWAKETKGITRPEMVVPITAHAAFDKASSYLGIKVHWIPTGFFCIFLFCSCVI